MNCILDLPIRMRRNRKSSAIRELIKETRLAPSDFIIPFFVIDGKNERQAIHGMPNIERLSIDLILQKVQALYQKGVRSIALFPVLPKELRSAFATEALNEESFYFQAIKRIKSQIPNICIMAEAALDPFTSHGHDGIMNDLGEVDNDATVAILQKISILLANCGADFIAPSDMMDGRIKAIRQALDSKGHQNVGILSYSIKYASSLYGPFREALQTKHLLADKRTYHMDPANAREAMLEAKLDEEEGADILMVKPALYYLDIITKLRMQTNRPIAAYHVSGEYAMVMAAAEKGLLDPKKNFFEALLSIKRAGANIIFTYAAELILDEL